jgi:RHS repeat-associated protein
MPNPYCVFGGEPIESPDGESLEGVGETRLSTGTIFTDKLFTGQREMAGLGIYHYGARFYSPKLGRFLSPDTIIPGAANPQAYNRYSYVLGNPLRYIDPTGHSQCQTQEDCDDMGTTPMGTGGGNEPKPKPKDGGPHDDDGLDPNPNSIISNIGLAISYLQSSPLGQSLYDYMIAQGFTIIYSRDGMGHLNGTYIEVPLNASPASIAGTIAHEAAHHVLPADGTLLQEYQAYLVGDIVRNDLIQAGHGKSSDMIRPLRAYTVDLNNPNRQQLSNDLRSWFRTSGLGAYIDRWHLPALPYPKPYR